MAVPVGGANFGSLRRACERVGIALDFSTDAARLERATHVLLPGVGAAGSAMRALRASGLDRVLTRLSQPILGICLGMQLLFSHSDEDDMPALDMLPGRVERLDGASRWPHMGWNTIEPVAGDHPLLAGIAADDWFYFVHGYAVSSDASALARSTFGREFTAVAGSGNAMGVQFHPEKSASAGRRLLGNFFAL